MRKMVALILFITSFNHLFAQTEKDIQKEDSILAVIKKTGNEKDRFKSYFALGQYFLGISSNKEEEYLHKAMFEAEQTRDREFIAEAAIKVVDQFLDIGGQMDRYEKALLLIDKTLILAKESQLNKQIAILLTKKAAIQRAKNEYDNAIKLNDEASNYAEMSGEDSIKVITEISYANSLLAKDESLRAFKKYMNALNIVETLDNDDLKIGVYRRIAEFYSTVKQVEKAKDYYQKVINIAKKEKNELEEMNAYQSLMFLLAANKEFVNAREYLNLFKEKASQSKNDFTKMRALLNEVNLMFQEDESKVAAYIRNNPKIVDNLRQWGYNVEADKALGIMYSLEKRKDSAEYYFQKAKSAFKPNEALMSIMGWNQAYAMHLERNGNYKGAIELVETNIQLAEKIGSFSTQKAFRDVIDSMYIKSGNKAMEVANKLILFKLKDSLEKQQKAKDLLNIEIDSENKRAEREKKMREEKLRKKHNLQYMGITAGIIGMFIVLLGLGRLKVKPWVIRALGFLAFILLFEFIILIADTQIHHLTHGEPLPILLIKIVLIAMLLPLHHWLEHKAIHYLLRRQHAEIK